MPQTTRSDYSTEAEELGTLLMNAKTALELIHRGLEYLWKAYDYDGESPKPSLAEFFDWLPDIGGLWDFHPVPDCAMDFEEKLMTCLRTLYSEKDLANDATEAFVRKLRARWAWSSLFNKKYEYSSLDAVFSNDGRKAQLPHRGRRIARMKKAILWTHKLVRTAREVDPTIPHAFLFVLEAYADNWIPTVAMETRKKKIFPKDFESSRSVETRERLPIGVPHEQETVIQGELPTLETNTVLVPALPLAVYHADEKGRGGQGAGTGAPGDEMIWTNSIVSVPREHRLYTTGVKITPSLREVLEYRYPNGWRRGEQLPTLIEDFYRIHNKRIVWKRVAINIVQVYKAPTMNTRLDDLLEIVIRFPEEFRGQNGPLIDMAKQNQRGLRSATEWRAGLRLAYFWDNHKSIVGKRADGKLIYARIYATVDKVLRNSEGYLTFPDGEIILSGDVVPKPGGGWHVKDGDKPQKLWYHPWATIIEKDGDRNPECNNIPPLTDDELIHLCYDDSPVDATARRNRLRNARQTLYKMQDRGDIVIEKNATCERRGIKGWRIIETRPSRRATE